MKKRIIYTGFLVLMTIFIYLSITSKSNISESIFSLAASGSLFSIIFKYFLDENKQLNDHYLNSNIVHDIYLKLTEFGEEYIIKLYETLDFLMQNSRNQGVLNYARDLYFIRCKYTIYLDDNITKKLKNFEGELRFIGANSVLLESLKPGERRNNIIDKISNKFLIIVNQEVENEEKISSIDNIINEIKTIIGATKIIKKRNNLI